MHYHSNYSFNRFAERPFNQINIYKHSSSSADQIQNRLIFNELLPNKIIASLSAEEFADFSANARRIKLAAGEKIYNHGDRIDYLYFPETAVFSQYLVLEDGRTCEIALIGNDGVLGVHGVSDDAGAMCWTETSVAGTAYRISSEVFKRNFGNIIPLQRTIAECANSYVEQLSQKVICNYFHQASERFCTWLLMLEDRCGRNNFSFTQETMARLLGVHRPSLSCITRDLQQEKLIGATRGKIKILDRERLEKHACSCYTTPRR